MKKQPVASKASLILNLAMILMIATVTTNCKKATAGPKGDTGATGQNGTNGTNGNANVKSKTYTNLTWVYVAPTLVTTLSVPEVTQDIVDNGAVMVALENTPNHYLPLPLTLYYSGYQALIDYEYYPSGIKIYISNTELLEPAQPGANLKFKVTIMAGGSYKKQDPKNAKLPAMVLN